MSSDSLLRDVKSGFRGLFRHGKFSAMAIATMGLGLAFTTALFTLVNAVLLQPLPFPNSNGLVALETTTSPDQPLDGNTKAAGTPSESSYPDFFDWRRECRGAAGMASYSDSYPQKFSLSPDSLPRTIQGIEVSADFFQVLGVAPALGRWFSKDEEKSGSRSVVISHDLWVSDFGASANILGQSVMIGDLPHVIIGVTPVGFRFPYDSPDVRIWETFARFTEGPNPVTEQRGKNSVKVIASLNRQTTLSELSAEMNLIQQHLATVYQEDRNRSGVRVTTLKQFIVGDLRFALYILFGAAGCVLLIACVNVAGLLLTRGMQRRGEIAVRFTLGASRVDVIRQLIVECLILSVSAGVVGVVGGFSLLRTALVLLPFDLPRSESVSMNVWVILFTFCVSLVAGFAFGFAPAVSISSADPSITLRAEGRSGRLGRKQVFLRGTLVIAETALSFSLLGASGLFVRSFINTLKVDLGFESHHVVSFRNSLPYPKYSDQQRISFFEQLVSRLSVLPNVASVSMAYPIPLSFDVDAPFLVVGEPTSSRNPPASNMAIVSPGYFELLKVPLLAGRTFEARDNRPDAPPVVIVNQAFAHKFLGDRTALSRFIIPELLETSQKPIAFAVVGVVGNTHTADLTSTPEPEYFVPYSKDPVGRPFILLRANRDNPALADSIRSVVAEINKDVPVFDLQPYDDLVARQSAEPKFQAFLLSCFAGTSLFLASVGLYATLSNITEQRRAEIGIRRAMGARASDIFRMIMVQAVQFIATGIFLGLFGYWIAARLVSNILYGVESLNLLAIAPVASIVLLVSMVSTAVPAMRAARLEIVDALGER